MQGDFNKAPNESPRSGGSKNVVPAVSAAIVLGAVAYAIWLFIRHQ